MTWQILNYKCQVSWSIKLAGKNTMGWKNTIFNAPSYLCESWCFVYFLRPSWQTKTKPHISNFILLHNMFQPSGPDHMLNKTGTDLKWFPPSSLPRKWKSIQNWKVKVLESEITKVLLTINLLPNILKKPPPLRGKIPRLRRPELLLAEKFSSSLAPLARAIWFAPFWPPVGWFSGFCRPTESSRERGYQPLIESRLDGRKYFIYQKFLNPKILVYSGTNWF